MLIFKRLEADDDSFKEHFEQLSLKYTLEGKFGTEDESEFESSLISVIYNIAELTGIFCAVTR